MGHPYTYGDCWIAWTRNQQSPTYTRNTMTYKFVIKQKLHGNDIVNTFHYSDTGGVGGGDIQTIVDHLADAYRDYLSVVYSEKWSMVGIDFYDTDDPPGTPAVPYVPTTGFPVGVVTGDAAANQLATLINWKCQQGPPYRGRTYLSGWSENMLGSVGNITQANQDAASDFADDIKSIPVSGGSTAVLVIYSTGSNVVPAGTTAVVTSHNINGFPRTQRRRAIGTGS